MATRCADSHQRSAGGTNFRTRLLFAAAEKSAHSALPFFHAHLPLIRKRQFSSLRPANGVPIIQKSPLFFSARRIYRGHPTHGQIRRFWQTRRRRVHEGEEFREGRGRARNREAHGEVFARSIRKTH